MNAEQIAVEFIDVAFECRMCKRPGSVQVPADFGGLVKSLEGEQEPSKRKFAAGLVASLENCGKLLCHHRCYDIWEQMRLCEDRMAECLPMLDAGNDKAKAKYRHRIGTWFDRWCANEQRRFRVTPSAMWQPEFADALAERPESIRALLHETRETIRRWQRDAEYWERWESEH